MEGKWWLAIISFKHRKNILKNCVNIKQSMNILPCQCKNNNVLKINWRTEGEKVKGIFKVLISSSSTARSQLVFFILEISSI